LKIIINFKVTQSQLNLKVFSDFKIAKVIVQYTNKILKQLKNYIKTSYIW
jgi:hypothetical protein